MTRDERELLVVALGDVAQALELCKGHLESGTGDIVPNSLAGIVRAVHEIAAGVERAAGRPSPRALQLLADWRECNGLLVSTATPSDQRRSAFDARALRAQELLPLLCSEYRDELDAIERERKG